MGFGEKVVVEEGRRCTIGEREKKGCGIEEETKRGKEREQKRRK